MACLQGTSGRGVIALLRTLLCCGPGLVLLSACHDTSQDTAAADDPLTAQQQTSANVLVADVIVIGAGISGLSTAIVAAENGFSVLVVDMASVFGGTAVISGGVLNIPVSPLQAGLNIEDSRELAIDDFLSWGEDADEPWVEYYVEHARTDIYDWTRSLGVEYVAAVTMPGNSVPRVHIPKGGGLALISAVYEEALRHEHIAFRFNTRAVELITSGSRVAGVRTINTRSRSGQDLYAGSVVIATGGFQSNVERVMPWVSMSL